jgi:hypothetical protein
MPTIFMLSPPDIQMVGLLGGQVASFGTWVVSATLSQPTSERVAETTNASVNDNSLDILYRHQQRPKA